MHLPKPPVALDVLLDKISLLHQNLAKAPSQLEVDLMKRYLQEYYAALHAWQHGLSAEGREAIPNTGPIAELRARAPQAPFQASAPASYSDTVEPNHDRPSSSSRFPAPEAQPKPTIPSASSSPEPVAEPAPPAPAPVPPPAPAPAPAPQAPVQTPPQQKPPQPAAEEYKPAQQSAPASPGQQSAPQAPSGESSTAARHQAKVPKPEAKANPTARTSDDYPAAARRGEVSPSINDRFARPDDKQSSPVRAPKADSLRKHIDLNERSLFTIKLFGGNSEAYGQAIRKLDEMGNLQAALGFFDGELRSSNEWNPEDRTVRHFRDLVEQHFR